MSSTPASCTTCKFLGDDCTEVDGSKLLNGYYCHRWREDHPAKIAARQQILYKFGSAGVTVLLNKPLLPDDEKLDEEE
jgi:hypothetical protein